ncbi:AfsR/SARP family transcriptional regulator [Microbispora sp. NPDC046933]|uniref:AfsR/SARP family transcriptional regulator n=1 Tax=Microbispora sp. NPDC046933 TaxID=3155618 RepID=UPI00340C41BB
MLGPLAVEDMAGQSIDIKNGKLRHLLALFLLNTNVIISKHWLIEHLWHSHAPKSALSNLKTYITRLRRLGIPILTQAGGYKIRMDSDELDAHIFENLASGGQTALDRGDLYEAAASLEMATRLWRGDPLLGMDLDKELSLWAERLREGYRVATEDFFEARLALGRHREIIAPLRTWVGRHHLRERAHAQLMTALYRDGRQDEALRVYQELRANLVTEIGVEPTPALRELQRQILVEDGKLQSDSTVYMIVERARALVHRVHSPHLGASLAQQQGK